MDVEKPERLQRELLVSHKTLMGPGPSNYPPTVLEAMKTPLLGHMHPETFEIMDDVKSGLQYIFQTRNPLTLALSASGHGGMEAVFCNLIEPGDRVLIGVNGIWGERAKLMVAKFGATIYTIETKLGDCFSLVQIENALENFHPQLLFIVQGESSTGVYQNLEGIGDICRRFNCLFAVDAVASLGGVPLFTDRWHIDAVYTGSQKILGTSPGLTPITFSDRAVKKILERETPIGSYYFDMTLLGDYWNCFGKSRIYHHTISTTLLYGLREGLSLVVKEGMENVIKRHQKCAERLNQGLVKLGFEFYVEDEWKRLPTVTAIRVPKDIDWRNISDYAMQKYNVEIAGGLGPTMGSIFRIGLMGYNAKFENVDLVLKVLKEGLDYAYKNKL